MTKETRLTNSLPLKTFAGIMGVFSGRASSGAAGGAGLPTAPPTSTGASAPDNPRRLQREAGCV
jgi:hypothetical protein